MKLELNVRKLFKATWTRKSLTTKIGIAVLAFLCSSLVGSLRVHSQTLPTLARISQFIDDSSLVTLENSTNMQIFTADDEGRVSPDLAMERILLILKSSPEQEAALEQLLAEQQDPSSRNYHQWLTPEEFGERFGASPQELEAVVGWLTEHGFAINNIANSRREIEFSGTASQVEEAFHTEIHQYESEGEPHIANATDISIPLALTPVVAGVVGLHDFHVQSMITRADGNHGMSPRDFATIYNVTSLWNQGFDGKGQSIAIVARSNINLNDVRNFRAQFGLPAKDPQIIVGGPELGPDPGPTRDEVEADLDVEWAGAVAKGATIKLVVSNDIGLSASYIVNHTLAPVMSVSYGGCESALGSANAQIGSLWQQAAAQGMSVFVSSGDSGSAGCENANSSSMATTGLGVNGLGSTPYNVAVGGTRFNENGSYATYWNRTNNFFNLSSARGYIPERVWNDGVRLWGTGGGVSTVWPKPSWQVGLGVPLADPGTTSGHHRYLPDVSLAASLYGGYVVRQDGHLGFVGGTSASAPAFAGIMAMINQMTAQTNGNPNPRLYAIANQFPSIFHDVTTGSNAVPCAIGSKDCLGGRTVGYYAAPGYDLATGWGSVDAYALAHAWAGR